MNRVRLLKLSILFVLGITMTASILVSCARREPERPLTAVELLELGEKYLLELNFEQALVQFLTVIEVEPMNPRGYTGAAEAHVGLGDVDSAISILRQGLNFIPYEPTITVMLEELLYEQERIRLELLYEQERLRLELLYEQERESLALAAKPILIEIAMFCAAEDYEAVFQRMHSPEFVVVTELAQFLNRPYIIETEFGKIGVYEVDSERYGNFMIYFGDYVGEIREGFGIWLGYYNGKNYFASGEWRADTPNGYFVVREWNTNLGKSVVFRVIMGYIANGLWNGDVYWNFELEDETQVNVAHFDNGKWIITETVYSDYSDHPYRSGGISLDANALSYLRGIVGFGDSDRGERAS